MLHQTALVLFLFEVLTTVAQDTISDPGREWKGPDLSERDKQLIRIEIMTDPVEKTKAMQKWVEDGIHEAEADKEEARDKIRKDCYRYPVYLVVFCPTYWELGGKADWRMLKDNNPFIPGS